MGKEDQAVKDRQEEQHLAAVGTLIGINSIHVKKYGLDKAIEKALKTAIRKAEGPTQKAQS